MAKAYSQDLRDRVIDAVERGEMSRRAAARRYEISESVAIKWLERVERDGSPRACRTWRPSRLQADAAPGLSGGRASREIGRHASGSVRSPFGRARGQSRLSRHRKRWRPYQGLIDPRRLVFIDETPAFAGAGCGRRPI
jgi:transposase-like protein